MNEQRGIINNARRWSVSGEYRINTSHPRHQILVHAQNAAQIGEFEPRTPSIMAIARQLALILGIVGCSFFTLAFVASWVNPGFAEQVTKNLVRYEVEKRVRDAVDSIDRRFLVKSALAVSKDYEGEIVRAKRLLSEKLPERLSEVIGEMQKLDCECRKNISDSIRSGLDWRIKTASAAQERLSKLIRTKYMETATQLTREFRIFTGTNALVFALLLIAVFVRRQAGLHLLPSALVLLIAASITAYLYLFNQNWLHSLVFSEYVGFAYIGYLGAVLALLSDIVFNRARVVTGVLNAVLNAMGSAVQVVPC